MDLVRWRVTTLIVGQKGHNCRVCNLDLKKNPGRVIVGIPSDWMEKDEYLPKFVSRKWMICPKCGSRHGGIYTITDVTGFDKGSNTY